MMPEQAAADYQAEEALREVAAGNRQQARADAITTLKLDQGAPTKAKVALVLAQAGETDAAQSLTRAVDKARPLGTLAQQYFLPTVRAAIALDQKDARRALELLSRMGTLELSGNTDICLYPAYLRGQAYLMLGDGKSAGKEFRIFIDHYGLVRNFPVGALARLGSGSRVRARGPDRPERPRESPHSVSELPHPLERRRPRYPHLPASQS